MTILPFGLSGRARLSGAIAMALSVTAPPTLAGVVTGPGNTVTVVAGATPEAWQVLDRASLVIAPAASVLHVELDEGASLSMTGATATAAQNRLGAAIELHDGSSAVITSSQLSNTGLGHGFSMTGNGLASGASTATISGSSASGGLGGMLVSGGSTLTVDQASRSDGLGATSAGIRLSSGKVILMGDSVAFGQQNGIIIADDSRGIGDFGRVFTVDASTAASATGSALLVASTGSRRTLASVALNNGTELVGGNGVALEVARNATATVDITDSAIVGDVMVSGDGVLDLRLNTAATSVTGRMLGVTSLTQASGSTWNVTGASNVDALVLNGGVLAMQPATDGTFRTVTLGGLSGTGGTVAIHTQLNEGGALAMQGTDRLLVEGDVTTTGTTVVQVTPTAAGAGAATDTNGDGVAGNNEGISVIQVGGVSRADAFALKGGYVAAGPWQYTLHAFGPGTTDAAQSALASGALNWDYRLASREVCEKDCSDPGNPDPGNPDPGAPDPGNPDPGKPDPGNPDPGNPDPGTPDPGMPDPGAGGGDSSNARVAVVPQVPSYLSAPAALMTYGDMLSDGLHQRLGDIRNGKASGDIGGEVFARYVGGQYRYSSNRNFQQYGYDFDQQVNALQLGGSILAIVGNASTLRAGWAIDQGTTRVTPKAVDGESQAKYDANGVSAWLTWSSDNGFYIDGVVGNTRYTGDIGTSLRGQDVARIHANAWHASVEAGYPIALGATWTLEPQLQLKHQALTFRDFRDADDLDVRLGTVRQTTSRVGAMLTRTADIRFMPYARVDLSHTSNGVANTRVSSDAFNVSDTFSSGRVGNAWRGSLGVVSQITPRVQLYGEGNYQHFVGTFGMRGWSANAGVRVSF